MESWQGPVADTVAPPSPTPTPQATPTPTPTPAPPVFHVPDLTADTAYRHVLGGDPDGSFVLAVSNLDAAGVTTDGTMIWVVDSADYRVYAYDTDGSPEPTDDFDLTAADASPAGITVDGGNLRVVDSLAGVVYRYDAAGNHMDDFSLTAGNDDPTGIATDGTSIWVVDEIDDQVYRYNTAGAFLDSFSLNAANGSPKGITVDGTDLWVVDSGARAVYRYTMAGAFMGLDFTLTAGNQDPQGITLGVAGPPDMTPPGSPTGLVGTSGDGQVSLDWDESVEADLYGYNVKRATGSGGPYTIIASALSNSDYVDNTVTNGTTYYYVVSAVDTHANQSVNSTEVSSTPTDATPPTAPTGLVVTTGDGQVSLDWDDNAESDLASYNVKRATSSGGPYTTIATGVIVSTYTDTAVTNDTTYFYVVSAVDTSANESANSTEASATPTDLTPPAAPASLVATTGDGQVTLDWADNSEGDLASYNVKRATATGGPYTTIATGVGVSAHTDTGVTNGTTYHYVVSAVDDSGNESANSTEVSATPTDSVPPAAPTSLVVTTGDGQVSLDWGDNAEGDLDGYNVKRATSSGGAYTDTAVTNDTTYFYVVSAVDASANESANSAEASATPTDLTPPTAPTSLVVTTGDGQVSLDWDDNAESDLASYNVKRATSSGGPYTTIATSVSVSAYTDTAVTNDTTYFYVVSAVDASANESANSAEASATPQGGGTVLYFTVGSSGTVGGLDVANEDVIAFDGASFTLLFDGSDVGIGGFTIDAMDVMSATEILLSFTSSGTVPDITGTVDDSDIVKFTSTELGATTSGTFEMYFDGSDVGLSNSNEDVDAVKLMSDGRILVSTKGSFSVTGVSGSDEDIVEFTPTSLGSSTSGSWALYFDGSDVGLTSSSEDVDGVGVDSAGKIYLSTTGNFSVSGVSGKDEDVVVFTPTSLGSSTSGTFDSTLFFDGSAEGVSGNDLFAIDVP